MKEPNIFKLKFDRSVKNVIILLVFRFQIKLKIKAPFPATRTL